MDFQVMDLIFFLDGFKNSSNVFFQLFDVIDKLFCGINFHSLQFKDFDGFIYSDSSLFHSLLCQFSKQ